MFPSVTRIMEVESEATDAAFHLCLFAKRFHSQNKIFDIHSIHANCPGPNRVAYDFRFSDILLLYAIYKPDLSSFVSRLFHELFTCCCAINCNDSLPLLPLR